MIDPDRMLDGAGVTKRVRWLTFLPGQAVDDERLAPLLHDAVRVATMTRGERLLSVLDRDAAP